MHAHIYMHARTHAQTHTRTHTHTHTHTRTASMLYPPRNELREGIKIPNLRKLNKHTQRKLIFEF